MKRFKKIYIEVTNKCNLSCDFCIKNNRKIKSLSIDEFNKILYNIKDYTDYLYFHVMGEPLIHPEINELINIASKNFKVNITTNGYMLDKIKYNKNIRQINISLHSFNSKCGVPLKNYLDNIFDSVEELIKNDTYISLRLWVKNKYNKEILDYINNKFNINISEYDDNYKINNYLFINNFHEFIWPDLNNNLCEDTGNCYALIDHIGILVDGTVVPCCLDSKGIINLGNIFNNDLKNILNDKRVKDMVDGFKFHKKKEELCKHCKFIDNKEEKI